jgi:hypothetical protein
MEPVGMYHLKMAGNPKPTKIFKFGGYLIFCAGTQNNHIEALLRKNKLSETIFSIVP